MFKIIKSFFSNKFPKNWFKIKNLKFIIIINILKCKMKNKLLKNLDRYLL